ncbi:hypothetical protein Vretimale_8381 [Volvox reticuliferus]|uniref:Uncharacterized protein n=1 Tax=Volvox reticuliferus TaxID=1737510 RepID=A0A8J4GB79_9CHLO|nr:hypothetical protein Vretifemale_11791 [Volvox reticuliferus]GIM03716.1 hypothetical protein Vretimale_8381 [Volvox reticuliferus]
MAPVDGGMEASRRMHEYLLSKQRKQEEYWLRKYGKVLQQPPPSVGKPVGNPRLPPLGSNNTTSSGQSSARGSNAIIPSDPSAGGGGLLPPLPGAHGAPGPPPPGLPSPHLRQPKGHAPIFHANEPVKDFFSRNARQPRASIAAQARDEYGNALPPSNRPPEPYRGRGMPSHLPPMGGYGQQGRGSSETGEHQHLQQQQEYLDQPTPTPPSPPQQQQPQQYGGFPQHQHQHVPQQHHPQASPRGGYIPPPRVGVPQPRVLGPPSGEASSVRSVGSGNGNGGRQLRNLEMELAVIRAIKAREDVLERLRIASGKLDSGFGGSAPVVLSPVDPMVRLFYRLVGTLRQRTLDVIESIAAWRRKVNPTDPFIYYGVDYLAAIGPDVGFLDELPFMRTRLTFSRAAEDPFLAEVTPDGIPIEEATTCDLRRGGQRFSSEALRIRMARKVLAHYCGRPLPGNASSYLLDGGSSAMSAGGLQSESSQPRSVRSRLTTAQGEDEPMEPGGGMTTQQIIRALSPPVPPVTVPRAPPARAITPPAAADSTVADSTVVDSVAARQQQEEEDNEAARREQEEERRETVDEESQRAASPPSAEGDVKAQAEVTAAAQEHHVQEADKEATEAADARDAGDQDVFDGVSQEQQQSPLEEAEAASPEVEAEAAPPEMEAEQTVDEPAAALDEQAAVPEPPQPPQQVDELMEFEDDNDFIDFALGAIIFSLERPYVDNIPPGTFTVAGWEIDRQLEEVVRGIASPEGPSRSSVRQAPAAAAAAVKAQGPALEPQRQSIRATSPSPAGGAPAATGVSVLQGSSRIPQPPSDPKPPSRGRVSDLPSRGSRIPASPLADRPPVRVHLRPGSSGLDMNLSMDEEGPMAQISTDSSMGRPRSRSSSNNLVKPAGSSTCTEGLPSIREDQSAGFGNESVISSRPPVRVHLKPRVSGLDMNLSMDPEEMEAHASSFSTSGQGASNATVAAAETTRPPVRVHLRPGSSGLDMNLSMDEEGPMAQISTDSSVGRPRSRSSSNNLVKPAGSSTCTEGLPSIREDQSAMFVFDEDQDSAEREDSTTAASRDNGAALSRPPVRVHLIPNSPEINMVLSMDDEMMMASPATVDSAADTASAEVATTVVPRLDDMPAPLQGPLSGRSNRASLRQSRQSGGSRPGSSAAGSLNGDGLD